MVLLDEAPVGPANLIGGRPPAEPENAVGIWLDAHLCQVSPSRSTCAGRELGDFQVEPSNSPSGARSN
jgi:hypothetical protein